MSLLTDDQCRVCFHVHPNEHPCTQIAHDPGPPDADGNVPDIASVCGCPVYVDLEAESHIIVRPSPTDQEERAYLLLVSVQPCVQRMRMHSPNDTTLRLNTVLEDAIQAWVDQYLATYVDTPDTHVEQP